MNTTLSSVQPVVATIVGATPKGVILSKQTLYEELATVDEAIAALEDRRTNIVNRIDSASSESGSSKVLQFPGLVTVKRSPRRSTTDWPRVSKAKSPDKS
jgi:hypothetical protein